MNNTNMNENKIELDGQTMNADDVHFEPAAVSTTEKERFIPITRYALLDRLKRPDAWPADMYQDVIATLENLASWRHQTYSRRLKKLLEIYLPFSPDRDTIRILEYSEEELLKIRKELVEELTTLLERANYEKITPDELDAFITAQGPYGLNLKVDMDEYDEVIVYYRGSDVQVNEERDWKKLYLKKIKDVVPVFQRLFLMLKLKPEDVRIKEIMEQHNVSEKKARSRLKSYRQNLPDEVSTDHVYLKTFKNIPQADLEMLFPNTKVEFRLFDKIKFIITAGGGTVSGIVGTATKVVAASNPITLAIAIAGFAGVVFRQVSNFFNQRNRYMMVLAQNLFFHSLASNRGALTLLLDRAEEEDIKEEHLLYSYLLQNPVRNSEVSEAQNNIETFLNSEFGIDIEFDFMDALERLKDDGLVTIDGQGNITAVEPHIARQMLAEKWNQSLGYPSEPEQNSNAA